MARPRPDDFNRDMRSYNSTTSSTPISYSANVNRTKTKKWTQASTVDYGGDDWGDDDYDGYDEPESAPVSAPRAIGLRQPDQAATSTLSSQNAKNMYEYPSALHIDSKRSATNPRAQRANSFGRDDERRAFSESLAAPPPQPHLSIQTQQPSQQQQPQQGQSQLSSVDMTSPVTTLPSFQNRGLPDRMPQMDSAQYPPRKSSISQQVRPETYESSQQSSNVSTTDHRPSTANSVRSPVASKALPFIRPADIYKRHLEEQEETSRRSEDGRKQSQESLRHTTSNPSPNVLIDDQHIELNTDSVLVQAKHNSGSESHGQTRLEPVAERKSEYGFSNYGGVPSLPQSEASNESLSISPKLPDLNRISGFGMDMFLSPTTALIHNVADSSGRDTSVNGELVSTPSSGSISAAQHTSDSDIQSPKLDIERPKRVDSQNTGTTGASPISSSVPSAASTDYGTRATEERYCAAPVEPYSKSASSVVQDNSVSDNFSGHVRDKNLSVNDNSPARLPALSILSVSGSQSTHVSEPPLAAPIGSDSNNTSRIIRPVAAERADTFRPSLPGGWTSYATTTGVDSVVSNDTVVPESEYPSQVINNVSYEEARNAASVPIGGNVARPQAQLEAQRPPLQSRPSTSSVGPPPPRKDTPAMEPQENTRDIEEAHISDTYKDDSGFESRNQNFKTSSRYVASTLSTQTDSMDDENDKLRRDIMRSLSPVDGERTSTISSALSPVNDIARSHPDHRSLLTTSVQTNDARLVSPTDDNSNIAYAENDDPGTPSVAPLKTSRSQDNRATLDEHRFSWEPTPAMPTTSTFANSEVEGPGANSDSFEEQNQADTASLMSSANSWDSTPVSEKERGLDMSETQNICEGAVAIEEQPQSVSYAENDHRRLATGTTGATGVTVGGLAGLAAGAYAAIHPNEIPLNNQLATTAPIVVTEWQADTSRGTGEPHIESDKILPNTDKELPFIDSTTARSNDVSPIRSSSPTTPGSDVMNNSPSFSLDPDSEARNSRRTSDFTKIVQFRDILAMQSADDRIKAYIETREQFALMDNGLADWLTAARKTYPDLNLTATTSSINNPRTRNKPIPLQQPYYQQYLNASSPTSTPTSTTPPGINRPATRDAMSGGSQLSHFGSSASSKAGAKSKELIDAAKGFGGMGVKVSKGLFAKGRSKIRGTGGGGDKVD